jgi:hypothetical protein
MTVWPNYQLEQSGAAGLNLLAGFGGLTPVDIGAPVAHLDCSAKGAL